MDAPLGREPASPTPARIQVEEPSHADCINAPDPEGNVKFRNYRLLGDTLRAYTPTGDVHTSPEKGKLVAKFEVWSSLSPPRARILELLRPEDRGRDALEAIVRPAPRRGLTRPLDEDTRRFLQRALLSPSPQGLSTANTPEPQRALLSPSPQGLSIANTPEPRHHQPDAVSPEPCPDEVSVPVEPSRRMLKRERSLAEELREAEEDERVGGGARRELLVELGLRGGSVRDASERDRLAKLALAVEDDEGEEAGGLSAAARRLDALLAESRDLHHELATIHEDIQVQCARACRCAAAARALRGECCALQFLDDVVALLRGEVRAAVAREWPFALGQKRPGRSYVV